jgi:predicted AlkP superfamily pyrophosphatase or phosphodiesterase
MNTAYNLRRRARTVFRLVLLLLCLTPQAPATVSARKQGAEVNRPRRALIISLDGLDARYLRDADRHGLKIPTLRRLMSEGVTAREGVVGVFPSVTYPSHTTLVTGASPRRHGVLSNSLFVPPPAGPSEDWYWFASQIKADTLWDAARRRGLTAGMVSWPVTTGAGDWNAPEIWKPGGTREESRELVRRHARPRGLIAEIERADPSLYAEVNEDEGDDMRTRFAEHIIREKRPRLMLVHLFDLDHFQHDHGPFTPEALAMLEKTDGYVARLLEASRRAGTLAETAVFVVSDHGFKPYTKVVHPLVLLERAGLVTSRESADARGRARRRVVEWRVLPHVSGASCMVMLKDPKDEGALNRALVAFRDLESAGALRIVTRAELDRLGADPRAAFALSAGEGHSFSGGFANEVIVEGKPRGQHGYLPGPPDYRAAFVASGAGVRRRGNVGEISMLDIGPTVARALGLRLRHAEGRALDLR